MSKDEVIHNKKTPNYYVNTYYTQKYTTGNFLYLKVTDLFKELQAGY